VKAPNIAVYGNNVTIRSELGGPGQAFPIWRDSSADTLLVEDTTLNGDDGSCVGGGNLTIRRVEMTGCENGAHAESNFTMVDSWVHDLDTTDDNHTDGIQMSANAASVLVRHNTIDPQNTGTPASTSAIIHSSGTNSAVIIENNRLLGSHASFSLYCPRQAGVSITVAANRLERGVFGYTDSCGDDNLSGNVDDVTGGPVGPSSGGSTAPLPNADNTGVPSSTSLTSSGSITAATAGAIIDARHVTGSITVNAPNVTIRRTRVDSDAFMAIRSNSTGLVVEDSEIMDTDGGTMCHNAVGGGDVTVRRVEVKDCENGADIGDGNVLMADNYIRDLAAPSAGTSQHPDGSPHTDGIQGGCGGSNITVRHNWIDPTATGGATAGIIMCTPTNLSASTTYRIEDNYIDGRGASYAVYATRQADAAAKGNYINRNRLLRGTFGYLACARVGVTVTEFNGNVDHGTGAALSASQMDNDAGCRN
jgi:hypothetical protein